MLYQQHTGTNLAIYLAALILQMFLEYQQDPEPEHKLILISSFKES